MLEPPADLPRDEIIAALRDDYGLDVTSLTFLPLGQDSWAWVFRADLADGGARFIKLRSGPLNVPGLTTPHYVRSHGVAPVIGPIATLDGRLWCTVGAYALIVLPFVEGENGFVTKPEPQHWRTIGAALRQIHELPVPPELRDAIAHERFVPDWRDLVPELDTEIAHTAYDDPLQADLAAFWRERSELIRWLVQRADTLGPQLAAANLPHVLCHADLHVWNMLIDRDRQIWIVDWDAVAYAPRERDLMFLIGGISRAVMPPEGTAEFLAGYGDVAINQTALAYYRAAWAIQDISDYARRVFRDPELGEESRRDAARTLMGLFKPGEIVALARESGE